MIQIYLEFQEDRIHPIVFELLGKAEDLCKSANAYKNAKISLFSAFPLSSSQKAEIEHYNIDKIYYLEANSEEAQEKSFYYDRVSEACSKAIEISQKNDNTSIILLGETKQGNLLASSLGIKKNTGITADCTDLYLNNENKLTQVRPAFSGNLIAEIITPHTDLQMATVRQNIFHKAKKSTRKSIEYIPIELEHTSKITILNTVEVPQDLQSQSITKAKRLVIIGNGVEKIEDVEKIKLFAKNINAQLAGTKLAIQKNLLPRSAQIGLSGQVVSPDFALLLGVSGSVQFMSGMQNIKTIIAINKDRNADIMKYAHYPIYGDLYTFLSSIGK